MTNVKITIDDNVEYDGDLGEWVQKSPDFVRDHIKPGVQPKPHMVAIMMLVGDAIKQDQPVAVEATTRSYGWDLKVRYGDNKAV